MAQPTEYAPSHEFLTNEGSDPNFPGSELDIEFNALKTTTDEILANLALIQRDDGALKNESVGYDQLTDALRTGGLVDFSPWATEVTYAEGAIVVNGSKLYRCLVTHTASTFSTDLANEKWVLLGSLPASTVPGPQGDKGWSPEYAIETDGTRRALKIVDWQGGDGTKPEAGVYVGASGLVASIGDAVDIRGPQGAAGDMQGPGTAAVGNVPTFANTDGTELADSGVALSDLATEAYADQAAANAVAAQHGNVQVIADLAANTVGSNINAMEVYGYATPGDFDTPVTLVRSETLPPAQPYFTDAAGAYFFIRAERLDLRHFGAFGSDNPDSIPNETDAIRSAFAAAIARKQPLYIPGAHYRYDGFSDTGQAPQLVIEGDPLNRPQLHALQADSGVGRRQIALVPSSFAVPAGMIAVTADVWPNEKFIQLSNVSQLAPGMVIGITSNKLWYYNDNSLRYCGELHVVKAVDAANSRIEIADYTRDFYDVDVETLTVIAWWPGRAIINNLEFRHAVPSDPGTASTIGLYIENLANSEISDCYFTGAINQGISHIRGVYNRFSGIEVETIGIATDDGSIGYGIQSRSSLGTKIRDLRARGCRSAVDFHSRSNAGPERDALVEDFYITGGGRTVSGETYFPLAGNAQNRGISTHGPSEGLTVRNGYISSVQTGIRIRGRDTSIQGVTFAGPMQTCVEASQGTGLEVSSCRYLRGDYPNKTTSVLQIAHPDYFCAIGGPTAPSEWKFEGPTTITGNVVDALRLGFVNFVGSNEIKAVREDDNIVLTRVDSGSPFHFRDTAHTGNVAVSNCYFGTGSRVLRNYGNVPLSMFNGKLLVSNLDQNSYSTNTTLGWDDLQKQIRHPAADNAARTFTIPAHSAMAAPVGSLISFYNEINTLTIAIDSDTLSLAGTASTGSRQLAANGVATALKVDTTKWLIWGVGLS